MKKTILTILLCGVMVLGITGCGISKNKIDEKLEPTEIDGISMTIKKDTLTEKGATIIIKDTTGKGNYIYGESFRIDKKENENWITIEKIEKNSAFNDMAYYVDDNGNLEMKQSWEYRYGKLTKGTYRLVKDILLNSDKPVTEEDKKYISIEFTIE